jgi:amylosucrase
MIAAAGYSPYEHRKFLKNYYSGVYKGTPAVGALFSTNDKTGDARISGSLASLCGLEKALTQNDEAAIAQSIQKILLMQAHSLFIGGVPMLFYGDECGYTNDYSYLKDEGKSYDNRWMHRPLIDWKKNKKIEKEGTVEQRIFSGTQKLISIRKGLAVLADKSNLTWITPHNIHVTVYVRQHNGKRFFGVFNFKDEASFLTWYAFKENGNAPVSLYDHWNGETLTVGADNEFLVLKPYEFRLVEG